MDIVYVLKRAGLKVVDLRKVSPTAPGEFRPEGIILHHTAGTNSVELMRKGRPDVPPPLGNCLVDKLGTWYVYTDTKANDSGMGSGKVLEEVRQGRGRMIDARKRELFDTVNGNPY